MSKAVRSVAMVVGAALLVSACGALSGLIPDQTLEGGVLGLGGGVQVELAPQGVSPSIEITPTETVWVGRITDTFALDALAGVDIPNLVSPDAITETIELGETIVVENPGLPTGSFTVTGLALGGTFTIGGTSFLVPGGLSVDGLAVVFADPACAEVGGVQSCSYTTASNLPSLDLVFTAQQVAAYWNLLRANGGDVAVDLTVTVTLESPGLPTSATVIVTIASGGATIEF